MGCGDRQDCLDAPPTKVTRSSSTTDQYVLMITTGCNNTKATLKTGHHCSLLEYHNGCLMTWFSCRLWASVAWCPVDETQLVSSSNDGEIEINDGSSISWRCSSWYHLTIGEILRWSLTSGRPTPYRFDLKHNRPVFNVMYHLSYLSLDAHQRFAKELLLFFLLITLQP